MKPFNKVLIVGPSAKKNAKAYGFGIGGYVTNVSHYVYCLRGRGCEVINCSLSVRSQSSKLLVRLVFPLRLLKDSFAFFCSLTLNNPSVVHILGQYRASVFRELLLILIARVMRYPVVYDVRAGCFESSYHDSGLVYRFAVALVVALSNSVMVESRSYQAFVSREFGKSSFYVPNFVKSSLFNEVVRCPRNRQGYLSSVNLLFVGFFYEGKGASQLLGACVDLVNKGCDLRLHIAGAIHEEVLLHADFVSLVSKSALVCHGLLAPRQVSALMRESMIYVYPTRHSGEGHNNSVNEAAAHGLPMILARHGFLPEVFNDQEAYFVDSPVTAQMLSNAVLDIVSNVDVALQRGRAAQNRVGRCYTSDRVSRFIGDAYSFACS